MHTNGWQLIPVTDQLMRISCTGVKLLHIKIPMLMFLFGSKEALCCCSLTLLRGQAHFPPESICASHQVNMLFGMHIVFKLSVHLP